MRDPSSLSQAIEAGDPARAAAAIRGLPAGARQPAGSFRRTSPKAGADSYGKGAHAGMALARRIMGAA